MKWESSSAGVRCSDDVVSAEVPAPDRTESVPARDCSRVRLERVAEVTEGKVPRPPTIGDSEIFSRAVASLRWRCVPDK